MFTSERKERNCRVSYRTMFFYQWYARLWQFTLRMKVS